ncbi:MAG: molybdopterin-dependent oxidoreductase, partial [Chloroflexota bacterium]
NEPLRHGHGAPLRLAAEGERGVEWVKWITHIEVNRTGAWLQPPLPLR